MSFTHYFVIYTRGKISHKYLRHSMNLKNIICMPCVPVSPHVGICVCGDYMYVRVRARS